MKKIAFTTLAAGLLIAANVGMSFAQTRGVALQQQASAQYCAPANGAQVLGGFAGPNEVVCTAR